MGSTCSLERNEALMRRGGGRAPSNYIGPEEYIVRHRIHRGRAKSEPFLRDSLTDMHNNSGYSFRPTSTVDEFSEIWSLREEKKGDGGFECDIRLSEMRLKHLFKDSFCKAFKECRLKRVNLRRCNNVDDTWLASMTCSSLRCLDLASCTQVTDIGLSQVVFGRDEAPEDLECLNLSNCHGVRCGSEVLGALACLESVKAKPSLRELNLACVVGVDDFCCIQHLPKLKALRSLELKGCEISDAALCGISKLPCLQFLCLSQCHHLTAAGLKFLASLKELQSLDIGWCQGLSMAGSSNGQGLPVEVSNAETVSSEMDIDPQLKESMSVVLSGLTKLEKLSVARARFGDATLVEMARLSSLRDLSLVGCEGITLTGVEAILNGCKALELLNISGCQQVIDLPRGRYANLRSLSLSGTRIRDHTVSLFGAGPPAETQLPSLTDLNLDYCYVGDSAVKSLAQLGSSLERLSLVDSKLTKDGVLSLATGLPTLSSLELSSCNLSKESIAALSKCPFLHTLSIDSREIGDADLQLICTLPSLTSLDFFSARITDFGMLRALPKMTKLVRLELCGGLISDSGMASLAGLVALEELNLRENINITSQGIAHLGKLSHLCHLNLSYTSVTGSAAVYMVYLFRLRILCLFGCKVEEDVVAWLMEVLPCIRSIKRDRPMQPVQQKSFFQFVH